MSSRWYPLACQHKRCLRVATTREDVEITGDMPIGSPRTRDVCDVHRTPAPRPPVKPIPGDRTMKL